MFLFPPPSFFSLLLHHPRATSSPLAELIDWSFWLGVVSQTNNLNFFLIWLDKVTIWYNSELGQLKIFKTYIYMVILSILSFLRGPSSDLSEPGLWSPSGSIFFGLLSWLWASSFPQPQKP